jgi:hypothetical protein
MISSALDAGDLPSGTGSAVPARISGGLLLVKVLGSTYIRDCVYH